MFTRYERYAKCSHCGCMYSAKGTCVQCALKWATMCELIRETTKMYNAAWEGRAYLDLPVDPAS